MLSFLSDKIRWLRHGWMLTSVAASLAATASGQPQPFSETWESYTNDVTPYGSWILDKGGSWGNICDNGVNGGKGYLVGKDAAARIRHSVNLFKCEDIVLQGWLYDDASDKTSRSVLGLTDEDNSSGKFQIRIGIGDPHFYTTYNVVFNDPLQSEKIIVVNTKLPREKGWHFMRLEIMHDRTVNYHVWNMARTVEKTGSFGWVFNKAKFNFVTIASVSTTPGAVGWDEIKAGSLDQVDPPPFQIHSSPPQVEPQETGLKLPPQSEDKETTNLQDSSQNSLTPK